MGMNLSGGSIHDLSSTGMREARGWQARLRTADIVTAKADLEADLAAVHQTQPSPTEAIKQALADSGPKGRLFDSVA